MYENKVIIQIGSHIGNTINDPIFKEIHKTTTLILVEPVPYLFRKLKKNYEKKNIDNIIFINKAVTNYVGHVELTIPSEKNDWSKLHPFASQLASINEEHCKVSQPKMITEKITVETTTLNEIIKDHNIKDIELLHTDTEGEDYNILMSYNFIIKPCKILFEHVHMDGIRAPVGKKYQELKVFLENHNYKLKYKDGEDAMFQLQK